MAVNCWPQPHLCALSIFKKGSFGPSMVVTFALSKASLGYIARFCLQRKPKKKLKKKIQFHFYILNEARILFLLNLDC
jgi:hypothetical protein